MIQLKIAMTTVFALLLSCSVFGQQTGIFTDIHEDYKKGLELFDQGVYEAAQTHFLAAMNQQKQPQSSDFTLLQQKAQLKHAQCAIRLNHPDGEKLIIDFIRDNSPSQVANEALIDIGNYYFGQRDYAQAIKYYQQVPTLDLSNDMITEMKFKMAYAYLVKKKYKQSQSLYRQIKDIKGDYYYPANYYYGVTAFQSDDFKTAIESFERVKNSSKYSKDVPYYITQIAFAQGDYNKVISYGTTQTSNTRIKKYREINKLVGQAYFERKEYDKALPYLEEHAESGKLRQEDLYQVAYTQYRVGKYADAIKNFDELKNLNSALGQNALYNLGDCHIKVGDKNSGRSAFKKASTMNFEKAIQTESQFLYAKLSYELGFSNEAIDGLQAVKSSSPKYNEAQELLSKVFLNTKNYKQALDIIEKMPVKSVEVRKAYQQVAYFRGVQLYNEGNGKAAKAMFVKSLENSYDSRIKALANYWIGDINYVLGDYGSSINDFKTFINIAKPQARLFTDEASIETANYNLGYNYLKKQNFTTAGSYFSNAVKGFERSRISNDFVKNSVYPDALLRAGDCDLKNNKYPTALNYYNKVISNRSKGQDYALYQKSIILGLQDKDVDKILALENLAYKNTNSEYADDALLELGATYLQLNKLSQAVKPLNILVSKYKNKSDLINAGLLKLGLIAYNQDQTDKALDYYKRVFSNNPNATEAKDALRGIEEIYIDKGEPEKYFAFLESIPGYKVSDATKDSLSFKTAENQYQNGNYDRAISSYTSYIRQFPRGISVLDAYYQRAESYYILKKYTQALPDYENLISRGFSSYYARSLRKAGLISYNVSKDFGKAYNAYSKWAEIATGDDLFEAQLGTVRSAYRLGGKSREVLSLAEAVKNNSNATQADKGEASFYIAKTALDAKDYAKAKANFVDVSKILTGEQKAEAIYQVPFITYKQGNLTDAESLAQSAASELGDYDDWLAKLYILLGDIYAQQGDLLNAQAYLEAIVDNYTGDATILEEARIKLGKVKALDANKSRLIAPAKPGGSNSGDLEMDEGN
jgi:tetratricopeptide (TPR) repeat protein